MRNKCDFPLSLKSNRKIFSPRPSPVAVKVSTEIGWLLPLKQWCPIGFPH